MLQLSRETRKKAEGSTDEGARGERSLLRLSRETRKKAEGTTDEGNSIRNNTLIYYTRPSWRSMTTRQERYPVPSHAAPRCFCQYHATRHKTPSGISHHPPRHITHSDVRPARPLTAPAHHPHIMRRGGESYRHNTLRHTKKRHQRIGNGNGCAIVCTTNIAHREPLCFDIG